MPRQLQYSKMGLWRLDVQCMQYSPQWIALDVRKDVLSCYSNKSKANKSVIIYYTSIRLFGTCELVHICLPVHQLSTSCEVWWWESQLEPQRQPLSPALYPGFNKTRDVLGNPSPPPSPFPWPNTSRVLVEHGHSLVIKERPHKKITGIYGNFSQISDPTPPFGSPSLKKRGNFVKILVFWGIISGCFKGNTILWAN